MKTLHLFFIFGIMMIPLSLFIWITEMCISLGDRGECLSEHSRVIYIVSSIDMYINSSGEIPLTEGYTDKSGDINNKTIKGILDKVAGGECGLPTKEGLLLDPWGDSYKIYYSKRSNEITIESIQGGFITCHD